jgi:hypothetical protein
MPIPQPHTGEAQDEFIARCAGDKTMNVDYPHTDQRVAVCFRQWRDHHAKSARAAFDDMRAALRDMTRVIGQWEGRDGRR